MTARSHRSLVDAQHDREYWGRLVESAVGAHLVNSALRGGFDVYYWRDRSREVDFVLSAGNKTVAIEVKSGRATQILPGMDAFARSFAVHRKLLVGGQGVQIEEFLQTPVEHWLQ